MRYNFHYSRNLQVSSAAGPRSAPATRPQNRLENCAVMENVGSLTQHTGGSLQEMEESDTVTPRSIEIGVCRSVCHSANMLQLQQ